MITEKVYQDMNRAFKTGEVKKELAKIEVAENRIFTGTELERVIVECSINTIIRKDIDFQKLLLQDVEYVAAQKEVMEFLDFLSIKENQTDENKEKVLKLVDTRDSVYNRLEKEFL